MQGGEHGTRNSALAARRADSGDHFVVAILRPLTVAILTCSGSVIPWRSLIFLRTAVSNFLNAGALFRPNSAMTPEQADQAGAKHRVE
jgi:hypothetical protein